MKNNNFVYKKYGNNQKVLIILPGWGNTRNTFDYYINNLKDKFTIYIFDYPGFGESIFPNYSLTIEDYAKYIKDFIKKNNINNPYILCHSFGCRIAILLISKYISSNNLSVSATCKLSTNTLYIKNLKNFKEFNCNDAIFLEFEDNNSIKVSLPNGFFKIFKISVLTF